MEGALYSCLPKTKYKCLKKRLSCPNEKKIPCPSYTSGGVSDVTLTLRRIRS